MLVEIDANGMISHARVRNARSPEIERGRRTSAITGIVVHQTDADTSASSLNSYKRPKANGAHFLIDTDGTIYQTAAIYQRTNHVGPLKARCLAIGAAMPCTLRDYANAGVEGMHRIEMRKPPSDRYPSNMEAIGIEMVGRATLPAGFKPIGNQQSGRSKDNEVSSAYSLPRPRLKIYLSRGLSRRLKIPCRFLRVKSFVIP